MRYWPVPAARRMSKGSILETVGVQYDPRKGVLVNDGLQTTNPGIYAAGDICLAWKFTHAAVSPPES